MRVTLAPAALGNERRRVELVPVALRLEAAQGALEHIINRAGSVVANRADCAVRANGAPG